MPQLPPARAVREGQGGPPQLPPARAVREGQGGVPQLPPARAVREGQGGVTVAARLSEMETGLVPRAGVRRGL